MQRDRWVRGLEIDTSVEPSGAGCRACEETGGWWLHLRRCAACGVIGCCNSSPSQHAAAHATARGHPILTSFEPGEAWFYDTRTGAVFNGPALAPPRQHPVAQSTPEPATHVPDDWQNHLN